MFNKEKMDILLRQFQRIFTLPLTRSTYRELQNAVLSAYEGDPEKANQFIEALLVDGENSKVKDASEKEFIKKYCIPARVAKEVHDRGEVLSMMTSDMGVQGEKLIFSSRIRRIDGQEFYFITDTEGMMQVMEHIFSRFRDASNTAVGKGVISGQKERLESLQEMINDLTS